MAKLASGTDGVNRAEAHLARNAGTQPSRARDQARQAPTACFEERRGPQSQPGRLTAAEIWAACSSVTQRSISAPRREDTSAHAHRCSVWLHPRLTRALRPLPHPRGRHPSRRAPMPKRIRPRSLRPSACCAPQGKSSRSGSHASSSFDSSSPLTPRGINSASTS